MRGKELNTLIEHELQLMLAEGFDKSPISAKALHIRLKAKGIVNGGLSTLSSLERKRLIAAYVDQQLGPLNLRPKEKQQYVNRKTRQALLARNQQLQAEVSEFLQSPLSQRASSTVMLCLVHYTSLMPHFCYLQKFSSLLYNIIFCQHILHLKMF
ncbi:hypothetical protein [Escherichia coli]|uniref:hypothetical protein n=1 Tax=Escherichia coli TaxID=562 RepID=UPI003CC7D73C